MRYSTNRWVVCTAALTFLMCVSLHASDNLQPWTCPKGEVWLECGELHDDLDYYGYPRIANGYYDVKVYGPETKRHLDECGRGYIHRKWKIKYHYDWHTCHQYIYVGQQGHYKDFDPHHHMTWPKDYDMNTCHGSMHPDHMPHGHNWPKMKSHYGGCSKVGIRYTDKTHPYHGYGHGYHKPCKVLHRTWEIIDWCQYDTKSWHWEGNKKVYKGQWFYTQKIFLHDKEAPTIASCPSDTSVVSGDCNGEKVYVKLGKVQAEDECGDVWISYSKKHLGDGYGSAGSGSHSVQHSGSDASGYFKPGKTEVKYLAVDLCGNVTECSLVVEVEAKDNKPPQVIAISSLTVTLMQTGEHEGMRELNPKAFNSSSSDNCTATENLKFSLEPAMVTCSDFGSNEVKFIVEDEAGNTSYAMVEVIVQSGGFDCMGGEISGRITGADGLGVKGVTVDLMDKMQGVRTIDDGSYLSTRIPLGYNVTISPHKEDQHLAGVDMFDYMLLSLHVDGYREIRDPFQLIAADIDGNGTIEKEDVWALQRLIAGVDKEFTSNTPWKFMRVDYVMPDTVDALSASLASTYELPAYEGDAKELDFRAIKIGDLGQAPANDPEGNVSTVIVHQSLTGVHNARLELQDVRGLRYFQIPVSSTAALEGLATSVPAVEGKFDLLKVDEERYLVSWYAFPEHTLSANEVTLSLETKATAPSRQKIRVDREHTEMVLASGSSKVQVVYQNEVQEIRNSPNPFRDLTWIDADWDSATSGILTVQDMSGKHLLEMQVALQEGKNRIAVDGSLLPMAGVFQYQLEANGITKIGKMLKVR
ncbi:MAG: hypothetical protein KTR24_00020 [Saprospiraceae bacterium]|nr:hypothetical protein [Saprospiraceae bacterium]